MKRLFTLILCLTFIFVPVAKAQQENYEINPENIFKLDIKTLRYDQKQLVYAILTGDKNSVITMLNADQEPKTTYANIPLTLYAIYADQLEILKTLIEFGFNPNQTILGVTPLELAVSLKRYEHIKYLLSIGVIPTEDCINLVKSSKNKKLQELFQY